MTTTLLLVAKGVRAPSTYSVRSVRKQATHLITNKKDKNVNKKYQHADTLKSSTLRLAWEPAPLTACTLAPPHTSTKIRQHNMLQH